MNTKPWYLSKTILGTIVAFAASVLQYFGLPLPAELQGEIVETLLLALSAGGAVLAVIGRIRASAGLSLGVPKPPGPGALALVLALLILPILSACATPLASTPAQTVYALQADYASAQMAAVTYLEDPAADREAAAAIRAADDAAMQALTAAQAAVRSGADPAAPALIAAARAAVRRLVVAVPAPRAPPPALAPAA